MVADQKSYQVEVRTAEGGCSPPESLKPTPIWDDWDRMGWVTGEGTSRAQQFFSRVAIVLIGGLLE
jgi:hypothetical protein